MSDIELKAPTSDQVKMLREITGLTQRECAEMCHASIKGWQHWEYGTGGRRMPVDKLELFILKLAIRIS